MRNFLAELNIANPISMGDLSYIGVDHSDLWMGPIAQSPVIQQQFYDTMSLPLISNGDESLDLDSHFELRQSDTFANGVYASPWTPLGVEILTTQHPYMYAANDPLLPFSGSYASVGNPSEGFGDALSETVASGSPLRGDVLKKGRRTKPLKPVTKAKAADVRRHHACWRCYLQHLTVSLDPTDSHLIRALTF
jgi:hypothetical protein